MEYCAGGSVIDLVKAMNFNGSSLPEELIATILYQTLKGTIIYNVNNRN